MHARHGRDEPFTFVVSAQEAVELRLGRRLAHEQEQMTLLRLALHHGDIERVAQVFRHAQLEELAEVILAEIHGVIFGPMRPVETRRGGAHFQARTHGSELGLNLLSIHTI
jgi:hypothetical protein